MWFVFVLAFVLCVVITVVHRQYDKRGGNDPLTNITRRIVFVPFLQAGHVTSAWWRKDIASLFRGPALASQNIRLSSEVAHLMQQNRMLSQEAIENSELRALLNFKTKDPRSLIPAEVLALKPFSERDTAEFSRGLDDGIRTTEPALDQNGDLAGQVTDVSSNTCDVLLLTDTLSSVGARVVDPSAPQTPQPVNQSTGQPTAPPAPATVGICVGDRSNLLQLTDLSSDADVQVGDRVVTSGLGDVYPKDIPIGKIVSINFDKTRNLKSAVIVPYADFNHLEDGFLIE